MMSKTMPREDAMLLSCETDRKVLQELLDVLPQFIWIARPEGFMEYANRHWRTYTSLTLEQAQGFAWLQCVHPDDRQRTLDAWQTAIRTGASYETEQRLRNGTTGEYRWFLARAMPVRDETGQVLKWFGTTTDIEEQKRVERQFKESRESLRVLAEAVPQLVWMTSPDGLVEYWNQRWYDYTGSSTEQALGHAWSQFLLPDDSQHALMVWHHALETGAPYEIEYRLKEGQTGAYRWFLARGMPVHDNAGQIVKWFGTCTDIHEKKQAEEELRVLVDVIPQLVWIMRPDGSAEYGNQRWCDYTTMTSQQYQGYGWLQAIHPDDQQRVLAGWQSAVLAGKPYEGEQRLRNGTTGDYRWFLARGAPFEDAQGTILKYFGTTTDIDERKRAEEALRQSQERANVLMNSNIIGINVIEGEQIVDANDTFLHMTGYTREDLRAGRINWMHMTSPGYLARTFDAHQELASQQSMTPYEKEYICKDGSRLPVLVGGVLLQHHPSQSIGFVLDNSARKELEQRKDDFISMASHELRTPLTALKMQTQLVRKRLERQGLHEAVADLARIETPIRQLERLIGELLDISKIQAGRLDYIQETVDLDTLLREVAEAMERMNGSHTIVVHSTAPAPLMGDRDHLGQVFINLLSNAIKYSLGANQVEIDVSTSAEAVTVSVRDHGIGIPQEQCEKIFERFYRVVAPHQRAVPGLGIGLSVASDIVKHHQGTITVESEIGLGSIFHVTLPLTPLGDASSEEVPPRSLPKEATG